MTVRRMDHHIIEPEFPADPHRGENIVGAVRVEMHLHFPFQYRDQGFAFDVVFGRVHVRVFPGKLQILLIPLRLEKLLADQRGGGHARCGRLALAVVDGFGVLAQRHFHGERSLHDHFVDTGAGRFHRRHLPADRVRAPGPRHHRRHAGRAGFPEAAVQRVHRVDRAELRGHGVGVLVAVVALEREGILPHPEMGVRVDKPGVDIRPFDVDDLLPAPLGGRLAHLNNFSFFHPDEPVRNGVTRHGVNRRMDYQHKKPPKKSGVPALRLPYLDWPCLEKPPRLESMHFFRSDIFSSLVCLNRDIMSSKLPPSGLLLACHS